MNKTLKMTLVAGALALGVAGQANAAIVNTAGLNNNVVLTVWDQTAGTSFTANLGSTIQSFLTNAGVSFGGTATAPAVTGADTAANNFTYNDAALTSYLNSTAAADTVTWSVSAGTNGGIAAAYSTVGLLTTVAVPGSQVGTPSGELTVAINNLENSYVAGVNSVIGTGSSITAGSAAGTSGGYAGGLGTNFASLTKFTSMANVGSSMNFYFLTPTATAGTRGTTYTGSTAFQFANAAGASTLTLSASGLTYAAAAAAVAPVPEPGEWLLMLSGLALVGFIASRRKNSSSVSFA